ncbi:cytochrome c oxidase biogenesis protein Cmc1-like protein [Immersiella caudata]|uniref:COX assembly mitochondrial protein n=1 Tax=Immersiella caudata TaxID=314043 RepID=A0AA39XEF9_9PEZI|nr:cytochrome c oxidase biogenesis protein Cmc1-like protein [Immersiella caudata]
MHPHLHTKDNMACEEVMNALEECHARGFMWKAMGMCNDAKANLVQCLKAERWKSQSTNRGNVADKKERIRQKWREIDENS